MKRNGNFFGEYGSLIVGIFLVAVQVLIYIDMHDEFSGNSIGFFLASSICGIVGILLLLGFVFLIKDVKISDIAKGIKKIVCRKKR
jgi:hypothetical protein